MDFIPRFHIEESGGRLTLTRSFVAVVLRCVTAAFSVLAGLYLIIDTASCRSGSGGDLNVVALLLALVGAALAAAGAWAWQRARRARGAADPDRWTFDNAADEVRQGADVVCTISDIDSVTLCRARTVADAGNNKNYVLHLKVAGLRKARQGARGIPSVFDADIEVVRSPHAPELRSYGDRIAAYMGTPFVDEL